MRFYFYQTPHWLKSFFGNFIWDAPSSQGDTIYLTFDDGPVPEATPYVLEELEKHDAKATFFVVGANVEKYPTLTQEIVGSGHAIGNHTFSHRSGWRSSLTEYLQEVDKCDKILEPYISKTDLKLFRPPYGRIGIRQGKCISRKYQIVMWSHLSGDFDGAFRPAESLQALGKAPGGSILVFHDSKKYIHNLKQVLPHFLAMFKDKGFKFAPLIFPKDD